MPGITGFSHISFSVTDLDASTAWYTDVLGFEVNSHVEGQGFRRNRLRHPTGAITLTLTDHEAGAGEPFDERRTGLDHLAFAVATIDDVHDFGRAFDGRHIEHSPVRAINDGKGAAITFRDPDNIQLEIFAVGG